MEQVRVMIDEFMNEFLWSTNLYAAERSRESAR